MVWLNRKWGDVGGIEGMGTRVNRGVGKSKGLKPPYTSLVTTMIKRVVVGLARGSRWTDRGTGGEKNLMEKR